MVIFLLALGMAIIPLNDALIKLLSDRFPLSEIVAIRAILCILIVSFFGSGIREVIKLPARVILLFSLRGMCLVIAMYLYFISLGSLPLSEVVSIFFVSPLLITLLSSLVLKEKIGIHSGRGPWPVVNANDELAAVLGWLRSGHFSPGEPNALMPLVQSLTDWGDPYLVLADYNAYLDAQNRVDLAYRDRSRWARMAILNTARVGKFSSDRTISEYASDIWQLQSVNVP